MRRVNVNDDLTGSGGTGVAVDVGVNLAAAGDAPTRYVREVTCSIINLSSLTHITTN